jgi:hypothetical protein
LSACPASCLSAPTAEPGKTDQAESPGLEDYRRTAGTLTVTATELRLCVEEARKLLDSPQLLEHIRDVHNRMLGAVDQTARQARGLTDHIAWRSADFLLLVFVLAIAYRALARRLSKKTA